MSIKPLNLSAATALMDRIDQGIGGELRAINVISQATISIQISVQDKARGFDWIDLIFQVNEVKDAKLVSDNLLTQLDCSEGITLDIASSYAAFALGEYKGRCEEASLYIIGSSMGYDELPFSG